MLRDAQAILVYLASKYDPSGTWYPRDNRPCSARSASGSPLRTVSPAPLRPRVSMTASSTNWMSRRPGPVRTGCFASSTSISGSVNRKGATGSARRHTRPWLISPVSPTSCSRKRGAFPGRIIRQSVVGAIASSGLKASRSCRGSFLPGRRVPLRAFQRLDYMRQSGEVAQSTPVRRSYWRSGN